jgi:DNA ligase-1
MLSVNNKMATFKPMLAGSVTDLAKIRYPVLATPKLDGIRCIIREDGGYSRKMKKIPNRHIQEMLRDVPIGSDGELLVPGKSFNGVSSAVMSEEGTPDFRFYVFDLVSCVSYSERMDDLRKMKFPSFCRKITPKVIHNEEELLAYEKEILSYGDEGIMIRMPDSPYKEGRSSEKEGYLLKLKRFSDSEAEVLGFDELLHNQNEATVNELGYTKRSSHKAGKVPAGVLGSFRVRDLKTNVEFNVSTGMTMEDRATYWKIKETLIGKFIKYKYQEVGAKDLPRFPTFLGFRSADDM